MPTFVYSAAERTGKIVKGVGEAADEKQLAAALKSQGLILLESKEKRRFTLASLNLNFNDFFLRIKPVGLTDKIFFTRNLAVMIGAGLPLTRGLEALAQETSNLKFRKIIADVNEAVVKGKSFAESLRAHREVFSDLYINMVEVGEASGKLTLVLKLLARQMKKDYDLRRNVRGALIYPAIIIIALLGVGFLMMIYVVPSLTQTIQELGVEIPFTTQIIMVLSNFLSNYALWVFAGLALLAFIFWRAIKTERGKEIFDKFILKAPIFGNLIKKLNISRLCRTLAYLITSGVPIIRSLEITSSILGNTLFRRALAGASSEIQKGKPLHAILETHPNLFSTIVIQMISVGEETGKISEMLLRLALFFEEDVSATTKNLSVVIEPILMIVIGSAVGFFAISMLQPIYSSLGSIGG